MKIGTRFVSKALIISALCFFLYGENIAQDTIVVQTFTWDSATRNDTFQFPDDPNLSFRKILMRYNMRCHDQAVGNGGVGCREWDYSCNTFIHDPSKIDSTQHKHPNFIISNFGEPFFDYTTEQTYSYVQYEQLQSNLISGEGNEASVGSGNESLNFSKNGVSKKQFLYKTDELTVGGLGNEEIYGLQLYVEDYATDINFLRLKIKETDQEELSVQEPDLESFTEVYFSNKSLQTGLNEFIFHQPFLWNGSSNLIIEMSYTTSSFDEEIELQAHETLTSTSLQSNTTDHYLQFEGTGTVEVPTTAFSSISDEITISFWAMGNEDVMPRNSTIFEGRDAANNRQVNSHLPWSNGQIYWDCGNDGSGFDRINKAAEDFEYEGQWNHYAFTKNAVSGEMKIYINGSLWHSGSNRHRPIDEITNMNFGSHADGGSNYYGGIDEFRVWNKELDSTTIQTWMHQALDDTHDFYSNLVAYYPMDEGSGDQVYDHSPHTATANLLLPNWRKLRGKDLFKNLEISHLRPNVIFLHGTSQIEIDTTLALDSFPNAIHSIIEYEVFGEQVLPVDTFFAFQAGDLNIFTESGDSIVGTHYHQPEATVAIEDLIYYTKASAKFEILSLVTPYGNGLDLGADGKTFTFDVTDYAPLLKGEKRISIEMGGQWQEELDIQFLFITGTPAREVLNIQNIWPFRRGGYGDVQSDRFFEPRILPLSQDADAFKIRTAVTGHGQNGEFIPREHYINVHGGDQEFPFWVWKECGDNPIYPQGGTWIFDRAGWCPGAATDVHEFWLTDYASPGDEVEVDYGVNGEHMGSANYLVSSQLVSYGPFNHNLDASIERIARPNVGDVEFERINPACNSPIVLVQNTGAEVINHIFFLYVVKEGLSETYNWHGEIQPLETVEIELPYTDMDFWDSSDENIFIVHINGVNGQSSDDNPENDFAMVPFERARVFDYDGDPLELTINTNLIDYDNYYTIKDGAGNIVMQRDSLEASSQYQEALELPPGCYTMNFYDISNDGLEFWFFPENGNGFLRFRRWVNDLVAISFKSFDPDFGAGVQYDFVIPETIGNKNLEEYRLMSIYPNPAHDLLNIELHGFEHKDFILEIVDLAGRSVTPAQTIRNATNEMIYPMDVSALNPGIYFVKIINDERTWTKQFVKP